MGQSNFLNSIRQGSFTTFYKYKILPSITAAQAILESDWGRSQLAKECKNLFGIKADNSRKGKKKVYQTKEYDKNGNILTIMAYFRKYKSYEDSLNDHGEFFHINKRYINVIGVSDYRGQAKAIQVAGYATDPQYANKLIQIIQQHNLQEWDTEVLSSINKQQSNQFFHIVAKGETISQIAQKYKVSTQGIIEANRLKNPNLIYPDQKLNIPNTEVEQKGQIYTVKKGDTLSTIAKKFNTTVKKLNEINNIFDVNKIQSGQKIYLNIPNNIKREGE